jgi:hypothetical protein
VAAFLIKQVMEKALGFAVFAETFDHAFGNRAEASRSERKDAIP